MKGRMERLVVFPFTAGCVSSSSVSICIQHGRRPKEDIISSHMVCRSKEGPKDHNDTSSDYMMKGSSRLPTLSKPNIYIGFHRLTRSIKSLSQSLVFKEETEEAEMEMEIGLPTDVKHVTHIGFDGSTTHNANGCNDNLDVSDLLSLCPDFVAQYEQRATFVPIDASCGMQDKSCKSPEIRGK
ncbi:CRIB domain-containing protein RIC4-like [Cynara cardunculus var. scolymus]|uniref:CRIB domain-containing protein RIC4-like n=1 Tax=Cynara cardunculus var. scolymus TaxID=59895 RepID=UPI000D62DB57|nr:CRIB domain-containing protein RIC4-like [Cynara cardunculus var. scolymus]